MKKTIAAITLSLCLIGGTLGSIHATGTSTPTTSSGATEAVSSATATPTSTPAPTPTPTPATTTTTDGNTANSQSETTLSENTIKDSAGILPTSPFYKLERAIEQLQIAITTSQEKLAALKAQFANERAAEAVVMANEGKDELAGEATEEYVQMLALAVDHINKAIEAKDQAVKTLDSLNKSYTNSQELLKSLLANASTSTKKVIEAALAKQDKAVTSINDFYTAKKAFSYANDQLEQAQLELNTAKESGSADAIKAAEEKVQTAEAVRDELKAITNAAEKAKKEVNTLNKQAQKLVNTGVKQVNKANETMEKITEDENKDIEKQQDKATKEAVKKARKEAQKIAKDARENAKEIAKDARKNAKQVAENAREQAKNFSNDHEDKNENENDD